MPKDRASDPAWEAIAAQVKPQRDAPPSRAAAQMRQAASDPDGARIPSAVARRSLGRPGNNAAQIRQFDRGKVNFETNVDLHGLRVEHARKLLLGTLRQCAAAGERNVLVVTGKGSGKLQEAFDQWMREPDFAPLVQYQRTARDLHGGSGARYILLRKLK